MNRSSVFTMSAPAPGGRRGDESVWQFLERSTEPIAADTRARWDSWLARMPPSSRTALIPRLKDRTDARVRDALAELAMYILLESVYPSVDVEPATGTGSYTDFAVSVPVRTHFEVRRKSPPANLTANARRLANIAAELEKVESPDFWLDVDAHSGAAVPSMRAVRQKIETWLGSLDYDTEVDRVEQARQARLARATADLTLDAKSAERVAYLAAHPPYRAPSFQDGGQDWSIKVSAHLRPAKSRGPGQFTVGISSAGAAHIETADSLGKSVRDKLKQHIGLSEPLVVVLDLSSPIVDDFQIAGMLYGSATTRLIATRDRMQGIWQESSGEQARPAAVLILRGIWLGSHDASAELWLPPGAISPLLPGPWEVLALGPGQEVRTAEAAMESAADCLTRAVA